MSKMKGKEVKIYFSFNIKQRVHLRQSVKRICTSNKSILDDAQKIKLTQRNDENLESSEYFDESLKE